jgi:hypothetical protein
MSRCAETSGILFKHACAAEAQGQCVNCSRPICVQHGRAFERGMVCVTCVRAQVRDPSRRGSFAHLRDDPYFYWYLGSPSRMHHHYDENDYALFDHRRGEDFGSGVEDQWTGS